MAVELSLEVDFSLEVPGSLCKLETLESKWWGSAQVLRAWELRKLLFQG
jgi:hypothetical protein